jgi:hypothetical protein
MEFAASWGRPAYELRPGFICVSNTTYSLCIIRGNRFCCYILHNFVTHVKGPLALRYYIIEFMYDFYYYIFPFILVLI